MDKQRVCVQNLELSVVLPDGLQEGVVLLRLVCFKAQISLQSLLLAFQTLPRQTHINTRLTVFFICRRRLYIQVRRPSLL